MRYRQLYPIISAMALAGCGSSPTADSCGDQRSIDKVYNGTLQPSHVPLSPGQILAVGDLMWCSSTLIAPQWVLTAQHCGMRAGDAFCMGHDPADARNCIVIIRVVDHPTADMTLLELATDARIILPEVSPIAIMTEPLNNRWLQVMAEAAGYGQTDQGSLGTRYFTAEPIVAIDAEFMTIDGQNQRGVCFGDSGGPVMVIAGDGTVRVAGALSNGDESCVGLDNFTRTDALVAWIESYTGPTVAEPGVCGGIDEAGACQGGAAMWCDNATLRSETCGPDTRCGWDAGASGFRCISGEDSCGGYDGRGSCNGNSAFWCEDGQLRQRDCSACGEVCAPLAASVGGAYCMSATGS